MKDKIYTKEEIEQSRKKHGIQNIQRLPGIEFYEIDYDRADLVQPKEQPWYWPGIIPNHSTTLIAGLAGIGKSSFLLSLVANASNGQSFSVGGNVYQLPLGNIILISAEDDPEYQILPKLMAFNADLKNIHLIKCVKNSAGKKRFIDLNTELDLIKEKIKEIGNVKLIVVDPVAYFQGEIRDHIGVEVANFINSLNTFAKENDLAIVLNKHLRKQSSGSSINDAVSEVGGSQAWTSTPRQCWVIARDHENADLCLFVNLKVNIAAKKKEAFVFKIIPAQILTKENQILNTTKIEWSQELKMITADEAVNKETYEKSKIDQCVDFIHEYITENGQSRLLIIKEKALKNGFSNSTFNRSLPIFEKTNDHILIKDKGIKGAVTYRYKDISY